LVIFGSHDGYLRSLESENGKIVWKVNINGPLVASPLYKEHSSEVICATLKGQIFIFNKSDGIQIWSKNLDSPVFSKPILSKNSSNLILATVKGILYELNLETKTILWKYDTKNHIFAPIKFMNDFYFFGTQEGNVFTVKSEDETCKVMANMENSVIAGIRPLRSDLVLILDTKSNFKILKLSQEKIVYQGSLNIGETFSTPKYVEGNLFVGSRDDFMYCFDMIF